MPHHLEAISMGLNVPHPPLLVGWPATVLQMNSWRCHLEIAFGPLLPWVCSLVYSLIGVVFPNGNEAICKFLAFYRKTFYSDSIIVLYDPVSTQFLFGFLSYLS